MLESINKIAYCSMTASLGMPVLKMVREFERNEGLSLDELHFLQWKKIRRLLKIAFIESEYYRELFYEMSAQPEDIKEESDFKKIPILTKSILKEKSKKILTKKKYIFLHKAKTSGSTGKPLMFYKDSYAVASTYAAMYRGHRWFGVDMGSREARLWGGAMDTPGRLRTKAIDLLLNRIRQDGFQLSKKMFNDYYQKIKYFKPKYLMGYPSLVYSFAKFLKNKSLNGNKLNLKFVKCTAEVLSEYQKELIEEIFNCPCISEYGSAETGVVSFECPSRNNHIMAESVYVEFENLDDNDKSEQKKLIITNLYNKAFPIIRYEIGDLAAPIASNCSCGISLPQMSSVVGRISDEVVGIDGKRFNSSIFSYIIKDFIKNGIEPEQIRFIQKTIGKIEVYYIKGGSFGQNKTKDMERIMKKYLTNRFTFRFRTCMKLESDISGKYRYFISHLNPKEKKM